MRRRACVVAASDITVRTFLAPQLRAMQELFDLTIVVNTANPALLQELGVQGTLCAIPIARPVSLSSDVRSFVALLRLMRGGRFDLVHSMTPKAGLLAMTAASLAGIPVRLHTFTGQVWATRRGFPRLMLKGLDRVVARTATYTLTDSPSQREFLIGQGVVPSSKIAVLGKGSVNGVDGARFRPDAAARGRVRRRLGIPEDDVVLVFVGRLTRDKGVLDLAEAFAALAAERPDVHLLVVGPDEQQMRPAMQSRCRRQAGRLHFLEFTTAPEDVLAASNVLCLPSYREGFGSVIIEAAAAGVPAVASRIYGIVDAIDEGTTGLLHEAGNVADLLAQLRRVAGSDELRRSLGEAGRTRACRHFSQRALTSALLDLYARLLNRLAPVPHVAQAPLATDAGGFPE